MKNSSASATLGEFETLVITTLPVEKSTSAVENSVDGHAAVELMDFDEGSDEGEDKCDIAVLHSHILMAAKANTMEGDSNDGQFNLIR